MQKKFSGIKPATPKEKKDDGFSIDAGKLVTRVIIGSVLVAALTIVAGTGYKAYGRWHSAWNEVQFALDNPKLVKQLQEKYTAGISNVETGLFTPEPASQGAVVQATASATPTPSPKVKGGK